MVHAVRKSRAVLIALLICLCIPVITPSIVFASSGNWVEVTSFSGAGPRFSNTTSFTIDHVEWRIKWEYVKADELLTAFFFNIIHQDTDEIIGNYTNSGKLNITEGILNITDFEGEFFLSIGTNSRSHSIIVEQNLDSIPELQSWIILPIFLTTTLVVVIYSKKLHVVT